MHGATTKIVTIKISDYVKIDYTIVLACYADSTKYLLS